MQILQRKFWVMLVLFFLINHAWAQYEKGQKFIDISVGASFDNSKSDNKFGNSLIGSFFNEVTQTTFRVNNMLAIQKLKSNNFASGYNLYLSYSMNNNSRRTIDSLNQVYERTLVRDWQISLGVGKSWTKIFPIGKKFGCDLSQNTNIQFGFGRFNFNSDSAEYFNEVWAKNKDTYGTINANLKLGLYYWVAPRIVLHSNFTIASGYMSVDAIKSNGTNQDFTNIYYNTGFYFPFSSEVQLLNLSVGMQVLLK